MSEEARGAAARLRRRRRLAQGLWIAWAIVVWNVVFDQVIVQAARQYLRSAIAATYGADPPPQLEAWMAGAARRGAWMATAASGAILLVGLPAIHAAAGRAGRSLSTSGAVDENREPSLDRLHGDRH